MFIEPLKPLAIRSVTSHRLCQRVIFGVAIMVGSESKKVSLFASSASWSQKPPGDATIEPDLSSTSMTLGVTIGMLTTDSPQSFGSKVVLPAVTASVIPPVTLTSDVAVGFALSSCSWSARSPRPRS
jgi:hypothetical protein